MFHIGTLKTRTTALQSFLYKNKEKMKEQGWCYPDFREEVPEFIDDIIENIGVRNGYFFYGRIIEDGIDVHSVKWKRMWQSILKHLLVNYDLLVKYILDNDSSKCGTTIEGMKIQLPSEQDFGDDSFIVVTCEQTEEIEEQLKTYGVSKGKNYLLAKGCMW